MQIETLLHSQLYSKTLQCAIHRKNKTKVYTPATLFFAKPNVQIILTSFDFYNLFHVTITQQYKYNGYTCFKSIKMII